MNPIDLSVDDLHTYLYKKLRRVYLKSHDRDFVVPITLHLFTPDGKTVELVPPDQSEEFKQIFALVTRFLIKNTGIVRYAFFCEAWVAEGYKMTELDSGEYLMPSEREDKKEVLFVFVQDKDGSQSGGAYELIRNWKTGYVIDLKSMRGPEGSIMDFAGRFADLFN